MPAQSMQQTLQMLSKNPSMMEEMRNTLASMSPEQMQAAVCPCMHAAPARSLTKHEAAQHQGELLCTIVMCAGLLLITRGKRHSDSHCRPR